MQRPPRWLQLLPPLLGLAILSTGAAAQAGFVGRVDQGGFVERAAEVGLVHRFSCGMDRVGSLDAMVDWAQQGIALGDLDGDADLDVVAAGRMASNHAFRNDGGSFTDVTVTTGIQTGELDSVPALADFDRDGDLDLFLGSMGYREGKKPGRDRLLRNEGQLAFVDVTSLAGTVGHGQTIDAKWFDMNRDGWPDLYVSSFNGAPNLFYRNGSDGAFEECAAQLGLDSGGSTHATAIWDVDRDGQLDVLVGNDYNVTLTAGIASLEYDHHLAQQPDGSFSNVSAGSGFEHASPSGLEGSTTMALSLGDVNYDGLFDVYKTEMGVQFLVLNRGWPSSGRPWVEVQELYGVDNPEVPHVTTGGKFSPGDAVGWGCAFLDVDNDLWLDLFKVNGHVGGPEPFEQQNYMFTGDGPSAGFHFSDRTEELGLIDGFDDRALAVGDLDEDGDLDLLVGPAAGMLRYFENRILPMGRGWFSVDPEGTTSEPGGEGVEVRWKDSFGFPHLRAIGADASTASQSEMRAHFGMGFEPSADVEVRFPSGLRQSIPGVAPGTRLQVAEPSLVELSSTSALAGSGATITVTAFAHSRDGVPLNASAFVRIRVPGLTAAGPVQHVLGNQFQRVFFAGSVPGIHHAEVFFGRWRVGVHPQLRVVGVADALATRLRFSPESARAGSQDVLRMEVAPRDLLGSAIGPGHLVSAIVPDLGLSVPFSDLGDGRYAADQSAPSSSGSWPVEVLVDGVNLGPLGALAIAGPVAPDKCQYYSVSPHPLVGMEPDVFELEVRPVDSAKRALGPGANVQIQVLPKPGTAPVTLLPDPIPGARSDGRFYFLLKRAPGWEAYTASGKYHMHVDGVVLPEQSYVF